MLLFRTLLIMALWLATALASSYPLTLTDEQGYTLTLTGEPQRVVSMLPSHTETVCALNGCLTLVGIDDFSAGIPNTSGLPTLGGGLFGFSLEAIVALEPDLVLVSEFGELAGALRQAGLTVYAGSPQRFEDAFTFFEIIGQLVNRQEEAAQLATSVRAEIAAVVAAVAGRTPPTVYYELDATPFSVGPGSFIGVLIAKAGGQNIVPAELGDFPMLDPEFVISADPEIIVLASAPYGESVATVAARPGWATLTAVVEGAIIELTSAQVDLINRPGPNLGAAVRLLASFFHPDAF
ncbi:MAG: ABC transporter substrate-binding protein [Truepera sp.]|nr:ABC transporter substrate-binding protein [Truepera sp.]